MDEYKILGRVGQGAHGYVMKGLHRATKKEVALKKVIAKSLQEGIPKNIMREILALRVLKFKYIVELLDVVPHGMGLVLVMEYLPSCLFSLLKDSNCVLDIAQIKCYAKMLLMGISFMHENCVMHRVLNVMARKMESHQLSSSILLASRRVEQFNAEKIETPEVVFNTLEKFDSRDRGLMFMIDGAAIMYSVGRDLKPANLLIGDTGILKIADLGLARIYVKGENARQYTHQVATRWYRAPELLYGSRNYTPAIDIWAAGCIIAEMLTRKPLFPGETDIEQLAIVLHMLGTPTENTWPGLKELPDYNKITFAKTVGLSWNEILPDVDEDTINFIKGFIEYDNGKRLTPKQALNHTYFSILPLASSLEDMPKPQDIQDNSPENSEIFENFYSEFEQLINGL